MYYQDEIESGPVDGSGPRLFEIEVGRIEEHWNIGWPYHQPIHPDDTEQWMEPPDVPPFLLGSLPEHLALQIIEQGGWSYSELAADVDGFDWRQPLRHIEPGLISEDVFLALQEIAPGSLYSVGSFEIGWGRRPRDRTYRTWRFHRFPRADANTEEIDNRPTIIKSECSPPVPEGVDAQKFLNDYREDAVFAYPSWLARNDKVFAPVDSTLVVTEEFIERWKATEISKYLRAENYEHDVHFYPSKGIYQRKGSTPAAAGYRWVDVD